VVGDDRSAGLLLPIYFKGTLRTFAVIV